MENNIFDKNRKSQILNSFYKQEIEKAYTEGIYADTPANRKLGRVGMSYAEYTKKLNGGSVEEQGDIGNFKKSTENGQIIYKGELDNKKFKIFQYKKNKTKSWVIEKNGERVLDENGKSLRFSSANEAVNKIYNIVDEENSEYKFPPVDYLTFNSVRWINPDKNNKKINRIHIHRYGKKKPEITITGENDNNQVNILLKNSEMKKLLVGISKKEDVSLKLDYSEEDMESWVSSQRFKNEEISLIYNADKGTIYYERIPKQRKGSKYNEYGKQQYEFPASALDRVLEQFKKK